MFPIRDHNPSGRTPFVTLALIAVNVGVFLAYWLALPGEAQVGRFFMQWGLVPRTAWLRVTPPRAEQPLPALRRQT